MKKSENIIGVTSIEMAKNLCDTNRFVSKLKEQMDIVLRQVGEPVSATVKTYVGGAIPLPRQGDGFTVYKLDGCPYSIEAGDIVEKLPKSVSYAVFKDLKMQSKEDIRNYLHETTNFDKSKHGTFPIVFAGPNFIGGCEQLKQFLSTKNLHGDGVAVGGKRRKSQKRLRTRRGSKRRNSRR